MAPKFDVYAHVTETIIAEIEAGTPPWRKPWTGSASGIALPTRHNGEEYRGINILMLWIMAAKHGYVSSRWMTYKQAQELGGQVRKGETSSTVVKYGTFTRENELGIEKELPYARAYRVCSMRIRSRDCQRITTSGPRPRAILARRKIQSLRRFSAGQGRRFLPATTRVPITAPPKITSTCRRLPRFTMRQAIMGRWPMR